MNKILFFICLLFIFFLFIPPVFADSLSGVIKRVDSDIKVANNFAEQIKTAGENPNAVLEVVSSQIPIVKSYYDESSTFYAEEINKENDEGLKQIIIKLKSDVDGLSSSLASIGDSIRLGNAENYTTSFNNYDYYIGQLNAQVKELNGRTVDYLPILGLSFWFSLIVSIILFVISRGSPILPAEKLRNQFEFALFKSSLWPFGGSAVSYLWGLNTSAGETYYVFWWPIIVGYFQFARGLYSYIRYSRPAINIAKGQQQNKLEKLLASNEFQTESLKEKAKEISEMSPVINITKKSCSSCGARNSNNAKYCKSCGNKL